MSTDVAQHAESQARFALIPLPPTPAGGWDFTDHVATLAIDMILIHNCIIRCLNGIYVNALNVKPEDETAFVGFIKVFLEVMHNHHEGEDTILFPFLQTKFDQKVNVDQHQAFNEKMAALEEYIAKLQKKEESFNGEKIRELVDSFGDLLVEHFHQEVY